MEIINKVQSLVDLGYGERFERLITEIESQPILHKDLQAKLDKIGNTPIAEPEIFKTLLEDSTVLALMVLTEDEIVNTYSAKEVGDFLNAVKDRVSEDRLEDGTFKATPNTENCILPNFLEARELTKLGNEDVELRYKLISETSNKEKKIISDRIEEIGKTLQDRAFEISGLDIEKLTEWEKDLIVKQLYFCSMDASLSSLGKSLGN